MQSLCINVTGKNWSTSVFTILFKGFAAQTVPVTVTYEFTVFTNVFFTRFCTNSRNNCTYTSHSVLCIFVQRVRYALYVITKLDYLSRFRYNSTPRISTKICTKKKFSPLHSQHLITFQLTNLNCQCFVQHINIHRHL